MTKWRRSLDLCIEFVPNHPRASHADAGDYPYNVAERIMVTRECADRILETVWFKHPERSGEVKYIHDVPRQSSEHPVRCWRFRDGTV